MTVRKMFPSPWVSSNLFHSVCVFLFIDLDFCTVFIRDIQNTHEQTLSLTKFVILFL